MQLNVEEILSWHKLLKAHYDTDKALSVAIRKAHPPGKLSMPFIEKVNWYNNAYDKMRYQPQFKKGDEVLWKNKRYIINEVMEHPDANWVYDLSKNIYDNEGATIYKTDYDDFHAENKQMRLIL